MSQLPTFGDVDPSLPFFRNRRAMQGLGDIGFVRPGGIGRLFGGMPMQRMPMRFSPFGGGGFFGGFGGFRPRFRRRARPQMPDFAGQITTLEDKIRQLEEQLAARQTATPMAPAVPDVMPDNVPLPFVPPPEVTGMEGAGGFAGTMGGMGRVTIPRIDVEEIRKNIEAMQIEPPVGMISDGQLDNFVPPPPPPPTMTPPSAPPKRPYVPPAAVMPMVDETPTRGGSLAASDMGGRRGKKLVKPIGTERVPVAPAVTPAIVPPPPSTPRVNLNQMLPPIPVSPPDFSQAGFFRAPEVSVPAPVIEMPAPIPMPSLPKFPLPQIDAIGRVAAPLTRGPVNTAINTPAPNLNLGLGKMPRGRIGMR